MMEEIKFSTLYLFNFVNMIKSKTKNNIFKTILKQEITIN